MEKTIEQKTKEATSHFNLALFFAKKGEREEVEGHIMQGHEHLSKLSTQIYDVLYQVEHGQEYDCMACENTFLSKLEDPDYCPDCIKIQNNFNPPPLGSFNWNDVKTTNPELELISQIAKRANSINNNLKVSSLVMDIELTHHTTRLDLRGLYLSKQVDFLHDCIGIWNNFDRETKTMKNGFAPRYTL